MSSVPMWVLVVGVLSGPSNTTESAQEQLSRALTFHAGFDDTTDAAFAHGDPRIHTALKGKTEEGEVGLKRDDIDIVKNGGHYGGALRFRDSGRLCSLANQLEGARQEDCISQPNPIMIPNAPPDVPIFAKETTLS